MEHLIKDSDGNTYDVVLDGNYIISYKKNRFDKSLLLNRPPDYKGVYYQIKESLPSRFDSWIIDDDSYCEI